MSRLVRIGRTAALGCGLVAAAALAHASCPEPVVNVLFDLPAAAVETNRSMREISQMAGDAAERNSVGLYRHRFQVRMSARVRVSDSLFGDSTACVRQADITIDTEHLILIAREFPPSSCAFEEALRHEKMHEVIYRREVRQLTGRIKEIAAAHLVNAGLGKGTTQQAREGVDRSQAAALKGITALLKEKISSAQKAFDSPEEYARFNAACDNQIPSIIREAGG